MLRPSYKRLFFLPYPSRALHVYREKTSVQPFLPLPTRAELLPVHLSTL